jgi:hypothetical protein
MGYLQYEIHTSIVRSSLMLAREKSVPLVVIKRKPQAKDLRQRY